MTAETTSNRAKFLSNKSFLNFFVFGIVACVILELLPIFDNKSENRLNSYNILPDIYLADTEPQNKNESRLRLPYTAEDDAGADAIAFKDVPIKASLPNDAGTTNLQSNEAAPQSPNEPKTNETTTHPANQANEASTTASISEPSSKPAGDGSRIHTTDAITAVTTNGSALITEEESRLMPFIDQGNKFLRECPQWIQEYVQWHAQQLEYCRSQNNYTQAKFMILSCFENDVCGGISDRMKAIPHLLKVAADTKRILLIHWSKKNLQLESFLMPAALNWTVPANPTFQKSCLGKRKSNRNIPTKKMHNNILCFSTQTNPKIEKELYSTNQHPDGIFREIFYTLFQLSPGLTKYIEGLEEYQVLSQKPYLAVHIRANYPERLPKKAKIKQIDYSDASHVQLMHSWANNAVEKVVKLYERYHFITKNLPIFVASDSIQAIAYLKASKTNGTIYSLENLNRKLNLEWSIVPNASAHFSAFADLLLLGNATCVSYGIGGYGRFGAKLANESCMTQHRSTVHLP